MFRLRPSKSAEIATQIEIAGSLPVCSRVLAERHGLITQLPAHFAHDRSRSCIGSGRAVFTAAKQSFANWIMFDLGWVRIANPGAQIAVGAMIGVEARTLGLWTHSFSRIVELVDHPDRFGFIYATTELHVEWGEERFLLEFDPATEEVWYDLEAVSRPRHMLARLGLPVARAFQHRFARDSHRRMREAASTTNPISWIPRN